MSITDELRSSGIRRPGGNWRQFTEEALFAIADRIDREHRMALEKVAAEVDALPMTDESMAEHGWIRLPVDADGVPIRIGDVLDEIAVATYPFVPAKVVGYHECCGEVLPIVENDGEFQVIPEKVCHHHAPTVEDVLREFADRYLDYEGMPSAGRRGVGEALMDEYAAKLRLAEEVDE